MRDGFGRTAAVLEELVAHVHEGVDLACDQLGLTEGTRLDFDIVDGAIRARPVSRTALDLLGVLRQPGRKPVSLQAMKQAVEAEAVARFVRATGRAKGKAA